MATAAQFFFVHKGVNKYFLKEMFAIQKSHGIINYITCILVLSKLENPWTDFHFFCDRLEITFFEIFLILFLKNRKQVKIAEIRGLKITITNATIIFARHRLSNFK